MDSLESDAPEPLPPEGEGAGPDSGGRWRRYQALAEISRAFAETTLDLEQTFAALTRVTVDAIGEGCWVRLLSEDGRSFSAHAVRHRDPAAHQLLADVGAAPQPADEGVAAEVVRTGQPVLLPSIAPEEFAASIRSSLRDFVQRFPIRSVLGVPLRAHGRLYGALVTWRHAPDTPLGAEDQEFLQEVADRAALAIHVTRLHATTLDALRKRDEFLSIASHELKTPLTTLELVISALARAARGGKLAALPAAQVVERVERAEAQVRRLSALIAQLLDVTRVSSGRLALEPEDVDLAALAQEVVGRFADRAGHQGADLTVRARRAVAGRWDRGRLDQVLTNLIDNALKFGGAGPVLVEVTALDRLEGASARLVVSDRGAGIAAADHERIFERYERATTTAPAGGLGLGLWIVREVVRAHGGTVRVDSRPGEGSRFVVELPPAIPRAERTA